MRRRALTPLLVAGEVLQYKFMWDELPAIDAIVDFSGLPIGDVGGPRRSRLCKDYRISGRNKVAVIPVDNGLVGLQVQAAPIELHITETRRNSGFDSDFAVVGINRQRRSIVRKNTSRCANPKENGSERCFHGHRSE
jgi:hypothetical protein